MLIYGLFTGYVTGRFNEEIVSLDLYRSREEAEKAFEKFVKDEFDNEIRYYEILLNKYTEDIKLYKKNKKKALALYKEHPDLDIRVPKKPNQPNKPTFEQIKERYSDYEIYELTLN